MTLNLKGGNRASMGWLPTPALSQHVTRIPTRSLITVFFHISVASLIGCAAVDGALPAPHYLLRDPHATAAEGPTPLIITRVHVTLRCTWT